MEAYTNHLADFHMILDLVCTIADIYFQEKLPVTLSYAQASILLCIGLQSRGISYIEGVMKLERQQILSLFIKVIRKIYKYLYSVASEEIQSTFPEPKEIVMEPHKISVEEDLNNAAREVEKQMRSKAEESANINENALDLSSYREYAIEDDAELENALRSGKQIPKDGVISVKSSRTEKERAKHKESDKSGNRRGRDEHGSSSKSKKKRKSSHLCHLRDEKSPSHKEMQKLIDDILDAEIAIEAGDFDKANAMVKELTEKLGDINSLEKEKLAKFQEMLKIVEEAMKESNKDKDMAIIATIGVNAKQQLGNGQQGADLKRELHEVSQSRIAEIIGHIKEATRAIERIDYDRAHKAIDTVYEDLKRDDNLLHDKRVLKFLRNMHEAEKDLRK